MCNNSFDKMCRCKLKTFDGRKEVILEIDFFLTARVHIADFQSSKYNYSTPDVTSNRKK